MTAFPTKTLRIQTFCVALLLLPILLSSSTPAGGEDVVGHLSGGPGTVIQSEGEPCGDLLFNGDDTFENALTWQYAGTVPPDWGAFAEKYSGGYEVCGLTFFFTQVGGEDDHTFDAYVWNDGGGEPGEIVCLQSGVAPGTIAFWPSISVHEVPMPKGCCVESDWWCGWWGDWPGESAGWLQAESHDGPSGFPRTKIAPGIGFPTGWQDVSIVWGPHQSLGIGANVVDCGVSPTIDTTWGRVKSLYGADTQE